MQEFHEMQEAFSVWLTEIKEEDMKVFRLCLTGIVAVQLAIWSGEQIECGIPIN